MFISTIYDIKQDYNMMLDSSLIDCFEETPIDNDILTNLIDSIENNEKLKKINLHNNHININDHIRIKRDDRTNSKYKNTKNNTTRTPISYSRNDRINNKIYHSIKTSKYRKILSKQ